MLTANRTSASSVFAMRFAGLFDCAALGARAGAVLRYSDAAPDATIDFAPSVYEDFLDSTGPVLNALNYAPVGDDDDFNPAWIPITRAKGIHSPVNTTQNSNPDPRRALAQEKADKTFYLAYDLYGRDNPKFHDAKMYSFDDVKGQNKLRTPQINNITLTVRKVE